MGEITKQDVIDFIDILDNYMKNLEAMEAERQKEKAAIEIPVEIAQVLKAIDEDFDDRERIIKQLIERTEKEVKDMVIVLGETVSGSVLQAVYCQGRTSWDTKGLDQAIKLIPALAEYKKQGDPYVTIRAKQLPKSQETLTQ